MSKKKSRLPDIFDFDYSGDVDEEWRGMPEFNQPCNEAYHQVIVSFEDEAGMKEFFKLINQTHTNKTKSVWFPEREKNKLSDLFIYDSESVSEDIKNENLE